MSAAIAGHGYREVFIPTCKCGWRGQETYGPVTANAQYEAHKAAIRHRLGLPPAENLGRPEGAATIAANRRRKAADHPAGSARSPALKVLKGGQS